MIATGPLTSERLSQAIGSRLGAAALAFYDAIAPIVSADSLDHGRLYALSRYGKGEGDDYLNAPLDVDAYSDSSTRYWRADQFTGHDFDQVPYFEGCLPVEEMARRGRETLRFGPMKPVGLPDPRTGREPHAVVQLRREDAAGQMWNLVGFQTRLRIPEQQRVFRMIPGLESAEFLRYGSIHRNSYLNSPASLGLGLTAKRRRPALLCRPDHRGRGVHRIARQRDCWRVSTWPAGSHGRADRGPTSHHDAGRVVPLSARSRSQHFQPMNANFGLLDPLPGKVKKDRKKQLLVERAQADFGGLVGQSGIAGRGRRYGGSCTTEAQRTQRDLYSLALEACATATHPDKIRYLVLFLTAVEGRHRDVS